MQRRYFFRAVYTDGTKEEHMVIAEDRWEALRLVANSIEDAWLEHSAPGDIQQVEYVGYDDEA